MLKRKLWRDFLKNRTQFLSIFLMSLLGMLVFVGLDAEATGLRKSSDTYYEQTNLADLWLQGSLFTDRDQDSALRTRNVKRASLRLTVDAKAQLPSGEPSMKLNFISDQEVSGMLLLEGTPWQPGTAGIWVDDMFALRQGVEIGDILTLRYESVDFQEPVRGIIKNPEYVYYTGDQAEMMPDYGNYGYGFLDPEEFPGDFPGYDTILVDIQEEASISAVKKALVQSFASENLVITGRNQQSSYQTLDSEIEQHKMMGLLFPSVFLFIAVLGIITTMTRMTANQRMQIGTLKALGFTRKKITRHYVSYGILISVLGAVLGSVLGYWLIPELIFSNFSQMYLLPSWDRSLSALSAAGLVLVAVISALVSFLACQRQLRESPADTLKPPAPKHIRHTVLEKSKLWLRMNFSSQWNLRDILRNKIRSLMGVIGVAGCTMLLICAFGCYDSFRSLADWSFEELMTNRTKILLDEQGGVHLGQELADQYDGQMIVEKAAEFESDGVTKTGQLTAVDDGSYYHFQNPKQQEVQLTEGGIALSYKMAQALDVEEGEFVNWHPIGDSTWHRSRISQIYRVPTGQGIAMTRKTYEKLDLSFRPTAVLTNQIPEADLGDQEGIQGIQSLDDMKNSMNETMEMMYLMVGILILAAIILGTVVLYNLGALSFIEKTREIATLKVLGFRTRRIRGILQKQNLWITAAGILLGIPLGYGLLAALCGSISESQDMIPYVSKASMLLSAAGTLLVSAGVNFLLSGKTKLIELVEALK